MNYFTRGIKYIIRTYSLSWLSSLWSIGPRFYYIYFFFIIIIITFIIIII